MGRGDEALSALMKNRKFKPDEILYVGLQGLHDYQEHFLQEMGVDYRVQDQTFVTLKEIQSFMARFDHILVHLDIDVLDAELFHSTYFANKELTGDGSGGGRMTPWRSWEKCSSASPPTRTWWASPSRSICLLTSTGSLKCSRGLGCLTSDS